MLNGRVLERSVGNNLDRTRCAFDLGCRLIGIEHADHDDVGCSWGWGLVLAVTLGESGIGREKRRGKGAGRKQNSGHDYPCSCRKAAAWKTGSKHGLAQIGRASWRERVCQYV